MSDTSTIDLTIPSVTAARELARLHALDRMKAAGREIPGDASDKQAFLEEYARLLWCVPYRDGGFDGLSRSGSEHVLERQAKAYHIPFEIAGRALWTAGSWPSRDRRE